MKSVAMGVVIYGTQGQAELQQVPNHEVKKQSADHYEPIVTDHLPTLRSLKGSKSKHHSSGSDSHKSPSSSSSHPPPGKSPSSSSSNSSPGSSSSSHDSGSPSAHESGPPPSSGSSGSSGSSSSSGSSGSSSGGGNSKESGGPPASHSSNNDSNNKGNEDKGNDNEKGNGSNNNGIGNKEKGKLSGTDKELADKHNLTDAQKDKISDPIYNGKRYMREGDVYVKDKMKYKRVDADGNIDAKGSMTLPKKNKDGNKERFEKSNGIGGVGTVSGNGKTRKENFKSVNKFGASVLSGGISLSMVLIIPMFFGAGGGMYDDPIIDMWNDLLGIGAYSTTEENGATVWDLDSGGNNADDSLPRDNCGNYIDPHWYDGVFAADLSDYEARGYLGAQCLSKWIVDDMGDHEFRGGKFMGCPPSIQQNMCEDDESLCGVFVMEGSDYDLEYLDCHGNFVDFGAKSFGDTSGDRNFIPRQRIWEIDEDDVIGEKQFYELDEIDVAPMFMSLSKECTRYAFEKHCEDAPDSYDNKGDLACDDNEKTYDRVFGTCETFVRRGKPCDVSWTYSWENMQECYEPLERDRVLELWYAYVGPSSWVYGSEIFTPDDVARSTDEEEFGTKVYDNTLVFFEEEWEYIEEDCEDNWQMWGTEEQGGWPEIGSCVYWDEYAKDHGLDNSGTSQSKPSKPSVPSKPSGHSGHSGSSNTDDGVDVEDPWDTPDNSFDDPFGVPGSSSDPWDTDDNPWDTDDNPWDF